MKDIKVVIGKNFGDEGKGAAVYRLCQGKKAIVVRHNGGAQAGHTVEDGSFRFVFHQLGSGSPLGRPTFWSHTFLPDLLKLGEEIEELRIAVEQSGNDRLRSCFSRDICPQIYAHPDCTCTTIYDVLLNSIAEQLRGDAKHGSCGMGIYEAVLRSREEPYVLRMKDVMQMTRWQLADKLRQIRDGYGEKRLQELLENQKTEICSEQKVGRIGGIRDNINSNEIQNWLEIFYDENVLLNVADEMYQNAHQFVRMMGWEDILEEHDTIVIESAQGLMLDEDNEEYYPHLTPSHTGFFNVADIIDNYVINKKADINSDTKCGTMPVQQEAVCNVEIVYVTRTYVTRHGAGRLDHECSKDAINPAMTDRTNVPNPWQDSLRYAKHSSGEEFFKYVKKDILHLKRFSPYIKEDIRIYLTHLDETDDKVIFCDKNMEFAEFQLFCKEHIGADVVAVPQLAI